MSHAPEELTEALERIGIGVESMASPTACRTFNSLLGERRRVGAAILPVGSRTGRVVPWIGQTCCPGRFGDSQIKEPPARARDGAIATFTAVHPSAGEPPEQFISPPETTETSETHPNTIMSLVP